MSTFFETENGKLLSCQTDETEITIPENVKIIGKCVFKGNRKIKKITLPNFLETIEAEAFKSCTEIEKITLPEGLCTIEDDAFKGCKKLSEINFPQSLLKIGDYAFHRCHSLRFAELSDSVKTIGKCAFLYCDKMEKISLGGVKKIERQTFANCTSLREIRLHSSLETDNLGDDIFTGCVNIKKITLTNGEVFEFENLAAIIGTGVDPIAESVARSVYQTMTLENGILYKLAVNLKNFEIPEGISVIEKSCFYNKKGITVITLPKSLREIKTNAFANCINLEEIIFQSENVSISDKAFKGCNNLERVILRGETYYPKQFLSDGNLPDLVKKIGEQILSDFYMSGKILMKYRGSEERVCIPDSIEIIEENCFENNQNIGRVIMPKTVRGIRPNAFKNCVSMQTVELSENLEIIERSAFENCKKLLKIMLPEKVKTIGGSAFKRCVKLRSFSINGNLDLIGDMAFYGCKELQKLDIPERTEICGKLVFFNSGIENPPEFPEKDPDIEYSETAVKPYEFCKDPEIKTLEITGKKIIGKYAYSACTELSELVINDPECMICEHAFEKCANLKTVKLNVKSIENSAFSFCKNLENIEINGSEKIGDLAFCGCGNLNSVKISDDVSELGTRCFEECTSLKNFDLRKIKTIGERAFSRCDGLENITIPNSVREIRRRAFEDCCGLKKIGISSETVQKSCVFFGCTNLTEIVLDNRSYFFGNFSDSVNGLENPFPERIREIIAGVFSCFDITEELILKKYSGSATHVKIPRDIIALGDEAFRNCIRTAGIDIPESVQNVGKLTFSGSGWLEKMRSQNKITVINNMLIDGFNCGKTVEIPENIKRICSWSFAGNTELREVKFLGNRTIIDEYAFRNCVGLKKIIDKDGNIFELSDINSKDDPDLPEYIRKIFRECVNCFKTDQNGMLLESTGNIKYLNFVNGIKSIGKSVYKDCNLLCEITLCSDTESIGESAFENSKWLKTVRNAVGVKRIENSAFCGCQSLEIIELSDSLESIGKRAFEHCCNLRGIRLPEGVRVIPERAFFRCKSLKKITFPHTLEAIEKEAFSFCTELEEIIIPENVQIGEKAFANCGKLTIKKR